MAALAEEIVSLVQDRYLFRSASSSVNKWDTEFLAKVYQRLLSVYDTSFDYTSSSSCVQAKLHHVQKCVRLLGIGHLAPRAEELTDTSKALRIISAIDDKISAKHSTQAAAKRTRVIMKQEEVRSKIAKKIPKVPVKENVEQENLDPNILSTQPNDLADKPAIYKPASDQVLTQDEWLFPQKYAPSMAKEDEMVTFIPTGRQLPRTPVKPSDPPPEDPDLSGTPQMETKDSQTPLENHGTAHDAIYSTTTSSNYIPCGRQLPRTPKADEDLNASDEQSEYERSGSLSHENTNTNLDLTITLSKNNTCKSTAGQSFSTKNLKKEHVNRRGTYECPPPTEFQDDESCSDVSEDRRGTFTLPPPLGYDEPLHDQMTETVNLTLPPPADFKENESANDVGYNENRRGTFTVPPPAGYDEENSHNQLTGTDSSRRGTFTLPSPTGYEKDETYIETCTSERRGTFNLSDKKDQSSCNSSYYEDDSEDTPQCDTNRRGTFTLSPPSEEGKRRGTYAITGPLDENDSRGTFAVSDPSEDKRRTYAISGPADASNRRETYAISTSSNANDRRGTYAISTSSDASDRRGTNAISTSSDASDRRGTYAISGSSDVSDRRETYAISSSSDASDRRGTYAISDSSHADRRGTYAISCSSDASDRRGTYAISGSSDTSDRRGTYAISGPSDASDRRGTYAISTSSHACDRRGTYAISSSSDSNDRRGTYAINNPSNMCIAQDYVGAISQSEIKSQVLVFDSPCQQIRPVGPIPDLSEFDDLPFTEEPSSSQSVSMEGAERVSKMSENSFDSTLKRDDGASVCHEEKPLPVTVMRAECDISVNPPTPKENYIPRGRQLPRTPNNSTENESKETSASFINTSENGNVLKQTCSEDDPNFSIQIFVKERIPKSPLKDKCVKSEVKDAVLIDIQKEDTLSPQSLDQESKPRASADIEAKQDLTVTTKKPVKKQVQNLDGTYIQDKFEENSINNSVDLEHSNLENKSLNNLQESVEFDDSLDIFPSKLSKLIAKSEKTSKKEATSIHENDSKEESEIQVKNANTKCRTKTNGTSIETENMQPDSTSSKKVKEAKEKQVSTRKMTTVIKDPDEDTTCVGLKEKQKTRENKGKRVKTEKLDKQIKNKLDNAKTSIEQITETSIETALDLNSTLDIELDDSDNLFLKKGKKLAKDGSGKKSASERKENERGRRQEDLNLSSSGKEEKETVNEPKGKRDRQRKLAEDTILPKRGRRKEKAPEKDDKISGKGKVVKDQDKSLLEPSTQKPLPEEVETQALPKRGRRKKIQEEEMVIKEKNIEEPQHITHSEEPSEESVQPKRGRRNKKAEPEVAQVKEEKLSVNLSVIEESSKVTTPPKRGRRKKMTPEELQEKEDSAKPIESSKETLTAGMTTKRGRRKAKVEPEVESEIEQEVNKQKDNKKIIKISTEESNTATTPIKRGRPKRKIANDAVTNVEETLPIQKGKKKNENLEESSLQKKDSTAKNAKDKQVSQEICDLEQEVSENASSQNLPMQLSTKSKTSRQTNKKKVETVDSPAKLHTRGKKVSEVKLVKEKDGIKDTDKEEIETTVRKGKNSRASKTKTDPEEAVVEESSETLPKKGRKIKSNSDSSKNSKKQNLGEDKDIPKAPRNSRQKKPKIEIAIDPKEVPAATGRASRKCKVKASSVITGILNSSDSDFLKTIRAYHD